MKAFVYILWSKKFSKTYIGCTFNVAKRLMEHNRGSNNFTRKYRPWEIIYTEMCATIGMAREREKYFKSHAGRNYIKNNLFIIPE